MRYFYLYPTSVKSSVPIIRPRYGRIAEFSSFLVSRNGRDVQPEFYEIVRGRYEGHSEVWISVVTIRMMVEFFFKAKRARLKRLEFVNVLSEAVC